MFFLLGNGSALAELLEISCVIAVVVVFFGEHQIVIFSVPLRVTFSYFVLSPRQQWISKSSVWKEKAIRIWSFDFSVRKYACKFLIALLKAKEEKKNGVHAVISFHTAKQTHKANFEIGCVHITVILNFQLNRFSL